MNDPIDTTAPEQKRQSIPLAVKYSAASEAGKFSGWASTFGPPADSYGDVIATGAFDATVAAFRAKGTSPALLWSHNIAEPPIGKITQLTVTNYGLKVDGQLALGVERGRDCYELFKLDCLGLSIGYRPTSSTPMGRNGRMLNGISLHEISAVSIPANSNSKIISVKAQPNLVDLNNPRVAERILRDGGYGHAQSKAIVSLAKTAFKNRDDSISEMLLARKLIAAAAAMNPFSH